MFPFAFDGEMERHGVGKSRVIWYPVLFLPPRLRVELPFDRFPRLRVEGEMADLPVSGAWIPAGDGRNYFIVPPGVRKEAELKLGDPVEMRFRIADQDAVDMPVELDRALLVDEKARFAWEALTPGKKRGFTHRVHGAKSDAARARRVAEVIAELAAQRSG